ncbi:MAG: hypothetical protein AAF830_14845 [Pseudomonadota bacterium]
MSIQTKSNIATIAFVLLLASLGIAVKMFGHLAPSFVTYAIAGALFALLLYFYSWYMAGLVVAPPRKSKRQRKRTKVD